MTSQHCPHCGSANTEPMGIFIHCLEPGCGKISQIDLPPDLDVTETHPAIKLKTLRGNPL